MEKINLKKGKYYYGICNETTIAMWSGKEFLFFKSIMDGFDLKKIHYSLSPKEGFFTSIKLIKDDVFKVKSDETLYYKNKEEYIEGEVWKPIPDYECLYEASNYGRIRREWDLKIMSQSFSRGYLVLGLSNSSGRKNFRAHRLVAMTFVDCDDERKIEVDHINENKLDNRVENLEWVTREENARRIYRNRGKKFSPETINKIREELKKGKKLQKEIAKEFSIGESMVSDIKNNKKWKI